MLKAIRLAAWCAIFAGIAVSAVRVVMALDAQAFDRVASAGLPAVAGLLGGALVLVVTHAIQEAATTRALLRDLCPTTPAGLIGLVLLLGGLGWAAVAVLSLDEPSVRAWAVVPAGAGLLVAVLGLVLMVTAALRGTRRNG
ncbi:hypothetical protein [Magnetospirillum aberrantis]|uniref:Uncharacterized protein n=1 Tax=Magnetospirillum aberrantis SpK TaxID=908842 RepID=A0A7C9QU59_9PROT|nr:hypothetical protein [Magnetospirillum aberrantis]NFV80720.1 hypothetical protein [Magnetospirillum aberrantis SpK]